jgi:hypothetical protein
MEKSFISKPHERTNTSYDISKKRVLTSELDPIMIEYRNDVRATDVMTEVEVYISSTWMYRRGLSTNTSYITYVSHIYKLLMCPDEAFVDMAVTE